MVWAAEHILAVCVRDVAKLNCAPKFGHKNEEIMSKKSDILERRLCAVTEYEAGALKCHICRKYGINITYIDLLVERYRRSGIKGLSFQFKNHYSDEYALSIMTEYHEKRLSLKELELKYLIPRSTLRRWLPKYEAYLKGDKFAFNGGRLYKTNIGANQHPEEKQLLAPPMAETEERKQRKKALSKLSKEELYELLLDRECELELLKKVDALVKKREARLRATTRKSSKD